MPALSPSLKQSWLISSLGAVARAGRLGTDSFPIWSAGSFRLFTGSRLHFLAFLLLLRLGEGTEVHHHHTPSSFCLQALPPCPTHVFQPLYTPSSRPDSAFRIQPTRRGLSFPPEFHGTHRIGHAFDACCILSVRSPVVNRWHIEIG